MADCRCGKGTKVSTSNERRHDWHTCAVALRRGGVGGAAGSTANDEVCRAVARRLPRSNGRDVRRIDSGGGSGIGADVGPLHRCGPLSGGAAAAAAAVLVRPSEPRLGPRPWNAVSSRAGSHAASPFGKPLVTVLQRAVVRSGRPCTAMIEARFSLRAAHYRDSDTAGVEGFHTAGLRLTSGGGSPSSGSGASEGVHHSLLCML